MSSRTLRAVVDTDRIRPTAVLRTTAEAGAVVGLTGRMMADLARELGSYYAASAWLARLATLHQRPVILNMQTGPDTSTTVLIGPRGWSEERARGWLGGISAELEEQFGPGVARGVP